MALRDANGPKMNAGQAIGPYAASNVARRIAYSHGIENGWIVRINSSVRNPVMIEKGFTGPGYYIQPMSDAQGGGGFGEGGMGKAKSTGGATPIMANPPQQTGGGQGFRRGANEVLMDLPPSQGDWMGLETLIPDDRLAPNKSPRVTNWDRFARYGSRCVRRGVAKLSDDIETVDDERIWQATIQFVAAADYTADTDYVLLVDPDNATWAFWFDTTGGDTEPDGSSSADNSVRVDISGDTTAADVLGSFNTARAGSGISGDVSGSDQGSGELLLQAIKAAGDSGHWRLYEYVTDSGFTIVDFAYASGSDLSSEYSGLGLLSIPGSGDQQDQLVLCFRDDDVDLGEVVSTEDPTSLHICEVGPMWGRPLNLDRMRGPDCTLSATGGSTIRVAAEYLAISKAALKKQTVKAITIRYTGPWPDDGAEHYPLDPDESTDRSVILKQRESWDGTSKNFDAQGLTESGRYFFAIWAHSLEGAHSEPARGSWSL